MNPRRLRPVIDPDAEEGYPLLDEYVQHTSERGGTFHLPPKNRAVRDARAYAVANKVLNVRHREEHRALYLQAQEELRRAFPDPVPGDSKRPRDKFVPVKEAR